MPTRLILTLVLCLCAGLANAADDFTHTLGHYSLNQQRKFELREKGKDPDGNDGLTLADQSGLAIHIVYATKPPDIVSFAKEEVVPQAQKATAKTVTKDFNANGLTGKRIIVSYQDPQEGAVVSELGFLGNGKDCVHWEITALKKTYDAEVKVIDAILSSIK